MMSNQEKKELIQRLANEPVSGSISAPLTITICTVGLVSIGAVINLPATLGVLLAGSKLLGAGMVGIGTTGLGYQLTKKLSKTRNKKEA